MSDPPTAHPLTLEAELRTEQVEPPLHDPPGVRKAQEHVAAVAQERGKVEGALAEDRLGVDREPSFLSRRQYVAAVEVLMADDQLGLLARQLHAQRDRLLEQPASEGATVAGVARG